MKYYILETHFVHPLPIDSAVFRSEILPAHVKYLETYIENGSIILTGPDAEAEKNAGGYTIIRLEDDAALEKFTNGDPLAVNGCANYIVKSFIPKDGFLLRGEK